MTWKEIGRTNLMQGDYRGAVEALDRVLAIEPQAPTVHFMLAQAHRALGDTERSQRHHALYQRYNYDIAAQEMAAIYLRQDPHANRERQPIHEHSSAPLVALHAVNSSASPNGSRLLRRLNASSTTHRISSKSRT